MKKARAVINMASNTKYYLESSVAQDTKIEVDLQEFTRFLCCVESNARGEAWLRQRHRLLKRRAEAVNTDEIYAGLLRGDARSRQAWGVFCDDCVELACIESKLSGRPPRLLTGPGMEHVIEHSRSVWAARAGVRVIDCE
jgi:hypothetical protein